MAQHDYVIANASGSAVRGDLNNALAAIVSNNSGSSEPSPTYAYQFWADTNTGLLKIRNAANNAWITLRELDGTLSIEAGTASAPGLYFTGDTNTGLYSPAADQFAIATAGVQRVNFNGATEVVFNDGGNDVDFRVEGDTKANLFKVDAGTDAVSVDGDFSVTGNLSGTIRSGTAVASTSGTSIDFTGIPSWVKRVTVMFNAVSTNGSSHIQVQIGSGSVTTTGYSSYGGVAGSTNIAAGVSSTTGFIVYAGAAFNLLSGSCVIALHSSTTYSAFVAGGINSAGSPFYALACGGLSPALSGVLDRIRITTVNGIDTFDAGSINILYEG